jgi:hypothetical protein
VGEWMYRHMYDAVYSNLCMGMSLGVGVVRPLGFDPLVITRIHKGIQ